MLSPTVQVTPIVRFETATVLIAEMKIITLTSSIPVISVIVSVVAIVAAVIMAIVVAIIPSAIVVIGIPILGDSYSNCCNQNRHQHQPGKPSCD